MSYQEKINNIEVTFKEYLKQNSDEFSEAFAAYVAESGNESKAKSEFGDKNFLEVMQSVDNTSLQLNGVYKSFLIETVYKIFMIDLTKFLEHADLPIPTSFIEHESLAEQAPEFYALAKVTECAIPSDYGTDATYYPIFPYILDCLSLPSTPTRFDAEITKYHLDILTGVVQNNPETLVNLNNICSADNDRECSLIKDMISSIQSNSIVNDEL